MKTVRFASVVEKCGAPHLHLAWVAPQRDPAVRKAMAENRVMTVHQELRGGKKDYGTIGYLKDRHAQILLFPKSLRRFGERRVVAVDYSLLAEEAAATRLVAPEIPLRPDKARRKVPPPVEVKVKTKVPEPAARQAEPWSMARVLTEAKRARDELAAGKSVPAYERLKRLVAEAQGG